MVRLCLLLLSFLCVYDLRSQVTSPYEDFTRSVISQDRVNSEWAKRQAYVVMISIDGFRHDYAEKYKAQNILDFKEEGVSASGLIPQFPSKTFPNHYSLVTGLYPANHGIVSNEFYSRSMDLWFTIKDQSIKTKSEWYGGTPLWVLAEQKGMLSASVFWVGTEAKIQNTIPTYYYEYDAGVLNDFRFRQVVDWLKLDEEVRPHFITTYFSLVDDAGHSYGPDSKYVEGAVQEIDLLFGQFLKDLDALNLPVHVVLVSDHGMTEVNRGVNVQEIVDLDGLGISKSFPPMIYSDDKNRVEAIYQTIKADGSAMVLKRDEMPDSLHYENDDRIGDLLLYTDAPAVVLFRPTWVKGGTHGFNPSTNADMNGIFAAQGPLLKERFKLEQVQNIHLYPWVARILDLKVTEPIDGTFEVLKETLRD